MAELQEALMLLVQMCILAALAAARREVKQWYLELSEKTTTPRHPFAPTWPQSDSSEDNDVAFVLDALSTQLSAWNLSELERRRIASFIVLERRLRPTFLPNDNATRKKD